MGVARLKPVKSLAAGFLVMAAAISMYSIVRLVLSGDAWLGLLYLMVLLFPSSFGVYLWRMQSAKISRLNAVEKLGNVLFALQGVALACWAYDLATTFYAINVARVAAEINPLGWPLGALGAFAYYAPTVILTYILLFRLKEKISLYAAVPMTVVALIMSSMNLNAGIGNFAFFVWTASLSAPINYNLTAFMAILDLAFVAILLSASRKKGLEIRK
ncbi:MAG TPA: hypothetical protein VMD05_04365, partial [Candidatus Nanoarchaeia archaeon]|nr:hypothetical protein [Candidatus Nanoarchaeia archaeon]